MSWFLNGIKSFNTSFTTTFSTSSTFTTTYDTTASTSKSTTTTFSTSKSTTTTFNTSHSTTTSYNTSHTTSYSGTQYTPDQGVNYGYPQYQWIGPAFSPKTVYWGGVTVSNIVGYAPAFASSFTAGGFTYYQGPAFVIGAYQYWSVERRVGPISSTTTYGTSHSTTTTYSTSKSTTTTYNTSNSTTTTFNTTASTSKSTTTTFNTSRSTTRSTNFYA
jgi:hypothetical protein